MEFIAAMISCILANGATSFQQHKKDNSRCYQEQDKLEPTRHFAAKEN